MEAEPPVFPLPDSANLDPPQPPHGFDFPKPDFTEIVQDEVDDKTDSPLVKPTFKNALQAKKRLQAFSSNRSASLPSSPKKVKPSLTDEKSEEASSPVKKPPKKGATHDDKAKAVIEEIEELKREEQAYLGYQRQSSKRSRTRSRSPDKGRFKKVDKKSRNYRRRSLTPEKPKNVAVKKTKKYPKNWREFYESDLDFDLNREFEIAPLGGNNELLRQILFESPSLPIVPFKMKTLNREEKLVPFEYIRYTRTKPIITYSANFGAIKGLSLSKKMVLDTLPKEFVANIEKLYSNSVKFSDEHHSKLVKPKIWYPKVWRDSEIECKLLEKSVGLSFLQTYAGEEDVDVVEEEPQKNGTKEKSESKETIKKKKKTKNGEEEGNVKVKKKCSKEKKKQGDEGQMEKKKKRKKDKKKKEKKAKDKKHKKEKKKKEKEKPQPEEEKPVDKVEKPNKQQVMEELKKIEEKLSKKREEKEKSETKIEKEKEKSRKRRHSEHEEEAKKLKHEKHQSEVDETKTEHALKKKLEKQKKIEEQEFRKEKVDKHEDEKKEKACEDSKKHESKKYRYYSDELLSDKKKKSRWSDCEPLKEEIGDEMKIKEEICKADEHLVPHGKPKNNEECFKKEIKETTPDTDEYHSHWESDDDMPSSVNPRQPLKNNRSWESDEELFERSHNRNKTQAECYASLEIPLNIRNFSRRSKWDEKLSYVDELKLLEEERKTLSEERRKLELEKQKILKLQEETKFDMLEEKKEEPKEVIRMRSSTPEECVKVKKEKSDLEFSIDSLNNSLLSNVSSTESNFPRLENEYEEFIKAVSSESKKERRSSSSSSSSSSSDSDHKKKKRKKKKKKKKKSRECEGLLVGKGNNIFNEFDIPVPSDLPEIVPTPVPVPSPIVLPLPTAKKPTLDEPKPDLLLTKPFVFSSIVLPKKLPIVDSSNLNLNDSDSADFTEKFIKKPEEDKKGEELIENQPLDEKPTETIEPLIIEPLEKKSASKPIEDISDVPLPPEKTPKAPIEQKPASPPPKPVDKSRKRDSKRRSTPPPRRRHSSPRRRSPPRRRGSPRRRSPSPRRRSPPRRRRRSPSPSPPRSRGGARKRTPSPRIRRTSPLNSPLDGFKRSVADSTISDDMLPQPTPDDYVESPPSFVSGLKHFDKKTSKSLSISPQMSPRRVSLDERISQVLGLEKNEPPVIKPPENYSHFNYNQGYGQQSVQYSQYPPEYGPQKNEYVQPFGPMIYTQPPPPIAKPVPPTKVVQVGNILQVVPMPMASEEIPPAVIENKGPLQTPERPQKIVQVGNMLQIVPAVIPPNTPMTPQIVEPPPPPAKSTEVPEKQSAETFMKQKLAEREKRRQDREKRRKEKERKRKEKEKRKQLKLKIKTENMIKRAIQLEAEALANDEVEEEGENVELPVQWPPVSTTPSAKGILLAQGSSRKRKSVQFADGVRPGEGTSPSGGEELSSPPPTPRKLSKEKRYKKLKIPKKSKKKKIKVKVKRVQNLGELDDDDEDHLPPPSPPPGSPPPHVFPSRVKTHTINNVHQYVGNILQSGASGFPSYRPPMQVVLNRHQPPPGFMPANYPPSDVNSLSHPPYQGISSHH